MGPRQVMELWGEGEEELDFSHKSAAPGPVTISFS